MKLTWVIGILLVISVILNIYQYNQINTISAERTEYCEFANVVLKTLNASHKLIRLYDPVFGSELVDQEPLVCPN